MNSTQPSGITPTRLVIGLLILCGLMLGAGLFANFPRLAAIEWPSAEGLVSGFTTNTLESQLRERWVEADYRGVIDLVDHHFETNAATDENLQLLVIKAHTQSRLEEPYGAIEPYLKGVAIIKKKTNVNQERYAPVYFSLGELHRREKELDKAIAVTSDGLVVQPYRNDYQVALGEYYLESGQRDLAIDHYRELLNSPGLVEEAWAVVQLKLQRLGVEPAGAALGADDPGQMPFYQGFSIRIQPINNYDAAIHLQDICWLLESKFLVPCLVDEAIELDEAKFLNTERGQYDGDVILDLLYKRHHTGKPRGYVVIGVTGKDIFAGDSNFLFSWYNWSDGVGVISSARFTESIGWAYEPQMVGTRRVGIQFISTVAGALEFQRAAMPHCPTSYPNSMEGFTAKGSKFCESEILQRDNLLAVRGGPPSRFDAEQVDDIRRVYQTYLFK